MIILLKPKKFTVLYKKEKQGRLYNTVMVDTTKKNCKADIKGNGFIPVAVYTNVELESIKKMDWKETQFNDAYEYVRQVLQQN
jgi:hypothetical protein